MPETTAEPWQHDCLRQHDFKDGKVGVTFPIGAVVLIDRYGEGRYSNCMGIVASDQLTVNGVVINLPGGIQEYATFWPQDLEGVPRTGY